MSIAIYPGSFDPVTLGHLDIIRRAAKLFDRLCVCVMLNSGKNPMFTSEERVELIRRVVYDLPNVEVELSHGLVSHCAHDKGATAIVKGLRAASDFDREFQMSIINSGLAPGVDTVFLTASAQFMHLSSTVAREMARYGVPLGAYVPSEIVDDVLEKAGQWR